MPPILVCGHTNLETTLRIDGFPLDYTPVRYAFDAISSTAAGVGFNVAKALHTLGNEVRLASIVGPDVAGARIRAAAVTAGLDASGIVDATDATAQSVILYDGAGRRQIHTDLKQVQDAHYPRDRFTRSMQGCRAAALCNINYSRPLLAPAKEAGLLIATDVHTISELDDAYNADFMAAAHILFMSGERLPVPPEAWADAVMARYAPHILVIGLGGNGALLATEEEIVRTPAVAPASVVSTVGAGDALFSCFLHAYLAGYAPREALRRAVLFAGRKICAPAASDGFLTADELERSARI
ncbi:MAG: carbohydrate kinase family protein [Caldilineaceae bacterium]|nr:carbohydrate kinase family protein [Caldilineaceae bacterium]